ncbi:MAG: outer membrane beta-barrel domain-containing protein [Deltaproteobacteria bacterium]|nr:outer membrane beta-barrel domain-containing protein [Deltaproteobacteria bacterium]
MSHDDREPNSVRWTPSWNASFSGDSRQNEARARTRRASLSLRPGAPTRVAASKRVALGLLLLLAGAGSATPAFALQGGEDPASLPVLLDKRFSNGGAHQLSLLFTTAIVTKFVESVGGMAAYEYSLSDLFALELSGGFFAGQESDIMAKVREKLAEEPAFSDLYQLQWHASADLVVVPIYGKVSFASTFDPSFDIYAVLGGGVGGVRRQNGQGDAKTFVSKTAPVFNFGLGFRLYFFEMEGGQSLALRLEVRDFVFPEPDPNERGLTYDLHAQAGLQFAFGGAR